MIVDLIKNTSVIEVHIGPRGRTGTSGQGVPMGGTTGQILAKNSSTNYDAEWVNNNSLTETEADTLYLRGVKTADRITFDDGSFIFLSR